MINVLVIGGAGYIGSVFVEQLLKSKKNINVVILDDLSTGFKENVNPNAKFYKGSQLDYKLLSKILQVEKINFVFHFAAKLIVGESVFQPIEYFENNVGGVINILKCMKENDVKNIIFSSTAAVYGNPDKKDIPIKEISNKNPINPYGSSKLADEYLISACELAYGINYGILRYFNVAGASKNYGSRLIKPTLLIPVINKSILKNEQMHVFGTNYKTRDGSCVRDYIHVIDLANAHIKMMDYILKNKKSNIVNLGTSKGFTVLEVINEAEKVLKKKVNYKISARRKGDPETLITNNNKAKKELGWVPKYTLSDMIKSDFEFRKNNVK